MLTLQFYTRKECTLCHSALAVVQRVQKDISFVLNVIDIDDHPAWRERYEWVIPVIMSGEIELARSFIEEKSLRQALKHLATKG